MAAGATSKQDGTEVTFGVPAASSAYVAVATSPEYDPVAHAPVINVTWREG